MDAPQDSDVESTSTVDNADSTADQEIKKDDVEVEKKKRTRQIKRRSQPNTIVAEANSKDKETVLKRRSHSNLVATGDLLENVLNNSQVLRNYDFRQRVQPMEPPVHPTPSASILLSSDDEAEILSRRPVRRGRPPRKKIEVAPGPTEGTEKPYAVVKSLAKYKVTVQEGNLLVRKHGAKEPTEAATFKDEEMKPTEPIISDVEEEEEIVAPSQVVVSAAASTSSTSTTATYAPPPRWMYLNCAEFLLALVLTALLFITYWCWNSDVC